MNRDGRKLGENTENKDIDIKQQGNQPTLILDNWGIPDVVDVVITQNMEYKMELQNLEEQPTDHNSILIRIS